MDQQIEKLLNVINGVVLGKEHQVKLLVASLFAKGHVLLEDLPGMGKTTLSHVIAKALGMNYNRIQFTSDLLPGDILGVTVFDQSKNKFDFRKGPVFAQVVLADEINRATPKAQGALLEAMEEKQVSIDGETHPLPKPFFVIATQNPVTQMGTFPLPESQLDRFLMKISLGYPSAEVERMLILGQDRRIMIDHVEQAMDGPTLLKCQLLVQQVHLSNSVVDYIQRLVGLTRSGGPFHVGVSPRGTLALVRASQAWAFLHGRNHVVPEDVQAVMRHVLEHRLQGSANHSGHEGASLVNQLFNQVDVLNHS
ncbi:MAG TPA: AAA family ATPase [Gammaproteobacteria bacterium]|nr:AAA family ATPase [Gammaproteobacteria bacterium]MEC8012088.1 MoxR family ATPase [Pseudomonadota bacterium]HBF08187.1 AAA family ATPase [Gammaproteobacteria bacterium]HCK94594.1 AAA family ATPase [Gammaproteobacteria bacterium]|tara:strand:+ start:1635 stop:2561 length:927 start_codon:yes stop_codon:yes gene_type:complete